jgi:hypothetical protein
MIQDALMELSQEEQALLKQAHFERHGNEVLH